MSILTTNKLTKLKQLLFSQDLEDEETQINAWNVKKMIQHTVNSLIYVINMVIFRLIQRREIY